MFGRDTKSVEQLYEKQKEKEMLEDQDASVYSVIFWYRQNIMKWILNVFV